MLCADQIETSTPPHPPPGKPRRFDHFLCPGSGEFDLFLGVVGKIEPEVSVLFFSGAEVSNVFRRDGRNYTKRYSTCERLAYKKKGLQKLCRIFEGMYEK